MMASCVSILSKRKSECLHAGIEKIDFESTVFHCALLANELIQAVALNGARAGCVGVGAVIVAGRSAVKFDGETNRLALFRGGRGPSADRARESGRRFCRGRTRVRRFRRPLSSSRPKPTGSEKVLAAGYRF